MPPKNLEVMVQDDNHISVQIGSSIKTVDQAGLLSPLAFAGVIIPIEIPINAVEFIVNPSANMRISEDPLMASYDVIRADTKEAVPAGRVKFLYILQDSVGGTLNFRFTTV